LIKVKRLRNQFATCQFPARHLARQLFGTSLVLSLLALSVATTPAKAPATKDPTLYANDKDEGSSLSISLDAPEGVVLKAVADVAGDGIIHGTYAYEKDQTFTGANISKTSAYYGKWTGAGKVFYKEYPDALAPRHFRESADMGTVYVRYVVDAVSAKRTHIQIDAIFVEDGRKKAHPSDGTVETSEFKEIQDRVREVQNGEQRSARDERSIPRANLGAQDAAARESSSRDSDTYTQSDEASGAIRPHIDTRTDTRAAAAPAAAGASRGSTAASSPVADERQEEIDRLDSAESSVRNLQQQIDNLRHDLEVKVKVSPTQLKTAPFESAANLQKVTSDAPLLIVVVTPYWYGVETTDGQHGWVRREQVEPMP